MYKAIFKLKTITPLFMYGADGKTPEIRASEFKGMMRFWWRSLNYQSKDNWETLLEKENFIFGGETKKNNKKEKMRSVVDVKVNYSLKKNDIRDDFVKELWGGRDSNNNPYFDRSKWNGLAYLFYSVFTLKSKGKPVIKKYIRDNFEFKLIISSFDKDCFYKAINSFWMAVFLGGFGTRARRGGGNLEVVGLKMEGLNDNEVNKFKKEFLNVNCNTLNNVVKELNSRYLFGCVECKCNSWKKCLNIVGKEMMNFRSRKGPDYNNVINYLVGNFQEFRFERSVFGLPIVGRFNNNRDVKGRMFKVNFKDKNGNDMRLASPLILSINKGKNDSYFITFFVKDIFSQDTPSLWIEDISDKRKFSDIRDPREIEFNFSRKIIEDFLQQIGVNLGGEDG